MKNKIKKNQKIHSVVFSVILLTAITLSGCREGQSTDNNSVPTEIIITDNSTDENKTNNGQLDKEAGNQDTENQAINDIETENKEAESKGEENQTTNNGEVINFLNNDIIGGKVRSVGDNSFIISRTLIDENGCVTMPEKGSPQEELVNIICTDNTMFENWTIQGGGAGIEKSEAVFANIKEGGGLEAEGYFEGENFIADKVIIEIYK